MAQITFDYTPIYSHGPSRVEGWPTVSGTTTGAGNPVMIYGAIECTTISICVNGGAAVVKLEGNQGQLDPTTFVPPANEWFDVSDGGYQIPDGGRILKVLAHTVPIWRTNIVSLDPGTTVTSSIATVIDRGFQVHAPKYPGRNQGAY